MRKITFDEEELLALRARQAAYRTEEGQAIKAYEEARCACRK